MKSLKDILASLVKATIDRGLTWQDLSDYVFECKLNKHYVIKVKRLWADDGDEGVSVTLEREGRTIDELSGWTASFDYAAMKELLDVARRNAFRIDEAIDEIEKIIKDREIPF